MSGPLGSSAPQEDRERYETMMAALDALAEGPLPGLAVDNIARYAAQRIRADAARLAALRERVSSLEADCIVNQMAVQCFEAQREELTALRTQAARDREALEELADHIRRRPPTFNDGTVVSRTWYLELERLAALRATEGGA